MTKEMKHTPGPWFQGTDLRQIESECGVIVCHLNGSPSHPGVQADARLIAAAPELLELLRELVDIEGPQPGNNAWGQKVLAAIAKATGEQQ